MKNILVSLDFGKGADILLEKATEMARAFGSKVWIVHIAPPDPDFVGYDAGPQSVRDTVAEALREKHRTLQGFAEKLGKKGVDARAFLLQGNTVETILKEAEKFNTDLIIAGHEDHNFIYKSIIGSVSSRLLRKSKIPVMLVPVSR